MTEYEKLLETLQFIRKEKDSQPDYGIILGTGLGGLVNEMDIHTSINYDSIPHFPVSTVEFHTGKLIFGTLAGKSVVTMQGRFHFYEGYNMKQVTYPVRIMKMLGIKKLLISNAAGALNPTYQKSDLMILNDHINLQTENPLVGKNIDVLGDRFPDMSEPYDLTMIENAMEICRRNQIPAHQGVYVGVTGPNLETKAEYKFLRIIGADAVGMSTVPENIVARQMGLPVLAVSVLTDLCYPGHIHKIDIAEIIAAARSAEPGLTKLFCEIIRTDLS